MIHTSPEKLIIERYVAGELGENKAHELTTHLAECSVCNEYHKSLTRERETFFTGVSIRGASQAKSFGYCTVQCFCRIKKTTGYA